MSFPLSRHPGTIVFVDDESNFLQTIQSVFSSKWILTFPSPEEFIKHMQLHVSAYTEMLDVQRHSVDRVKRSGSVPLEVLRYWNQYPERFDHPQVVVIDYYMPSMNGLEALAECEGWNGRKILLTGADKESLIAGAFNEHRIDHFIPKQNSKLINLIKTGIQSMLAKTSDEDQAKWNAWYLSITSEQRLILQEPELQTVLNEFVGTDYEHVVIGAPFGVLALGFNGGVKWLQLDKASDLDAVADEAKANGASQDEVSSIRHGRALSNARILKSLGSGAAPTYSDVSVRVKLPSSNDILYGASFELKDVGEPPANICFNGWQRKSKG